MKHFTLIILSIFFLNKINAQIVAFSDSELKSFLTSEECAILSDTGTVYENPDLNNDNEIQLSEADNIYGLNIQSNSTGTYNIKSIEDLEQLNNLKSLRLVLLDSIEVIDKPQLDSLKSLEINDCLNLKVLDLSNLYGLTESLKIIGADGMTYLNIQNGSVANQFSMFYTINTQYACIDSIAAELNEMIATGAMSSGVTPAFNCSPLSNDEIINYRVEILLYPNPTKGIFFLETEAQIKELKLLNIYGQEVLKIENPKGEIDISHLQKGIYFAQVVTDEKNIKLVKLIKE